MPTLILRLLGIALFLATPLVLGAAAIAAIAGLASGRGRVAAIAALGGAGWAAAYAALLAAGPLLTPRRLLDPGDELAFCGLDCHLHVSVASVERAAGLVVTLRLRSDAREAPEYPSHLRVRAVDAAGNVYAPAGTLDGALGAGETREAALRFALPATARAPRLVVSWGDWEDYLVPGPENALVQQRRAIRLDGGSAS